MTLSYDMTFFALVRMVLVKTDFKITKRRCMIHPLKKRPMMDDNEALMYASYVSAVLTSYKVKDALFDEKGFKKLAAGLMMPYAKHLKRKARLAAYEIESIASDMMEKTRALEEEKCPTPDRLADLFGEMLGILLGMGLSGWEKTIAHEIGLHTGRFVYLIDAVCDYEDDRKTGAYNPFIYAFSENDEMTRFKTEILPGVLRLESDAVLRAVSLLDFEDKPMFYACIENMIMDGMESALSEAVGKETINGK